MIFNHDPTDIVLACVSICILNLFTYTLNKLFIWKKKLCLFSLFLKKKKKGLHMPVNKKISAINLKKDK